MVGVAGAATTVMLACAVWALPPLVTTTDAVMMPAAPAVKVATFVPSPAVSVPPVIVQAKFEPASAVTTAKRPVAPADTVAGAVTTGVTCLLLPHATVSARIAAARWAAQRRLWDIRVAPCGLLGRA